jgi:tetratricopeptide (TPR) repeat protein
MRTRVVAAVLAALGAAAVWAQGDPERLRAAKALFFDRKYAEARTAWGQILAGASGEQAATAAYWVARSSEHLGEHERAFREYTAFLDRRPQDRTLAEEARTNRVGLAARLYKDGRRSYLGVLQEGLRDPSKTVRYYAALQMSGLGPEAGRHALPVLKEIVGRETDEDLVQRAKLAILRIDPAALKDVPAAAGTRPAGQGRTLHVQVFEHGRRKVSVQVPLALAELLFKSLPEEARRELRREGYDAETFWPRLEKLGPTEVIDIEGDSGEHIRIWID